MKIVKAWRASSDSYVEYAVETEFEAHRRSRDTWGSQHDRVERKIVTGGVPTIWPVFHRTASD